MSDMYSRNVPGVRDVLSTVTAGIAGCGGLGSHVADSLVRAGIGHLILADHDTVELSNLNRQLFFRADTGTPKVTALKHRLRAIRDDITLSTHRTEVTSHTATDLFGTADILVEAFDDPGEKIMLIESWMNRFPDRYIVSASGLAGTGHLDQLRVERRGNLFICGDGVRDMTQGLSAGRVAVVANMQVETVIELMTGELP